MKKTDFENLVRGIVAEEVKKQLPKAISEVFYKVLNENQETISEDIEPEYIKPEPKKSQPVRQYKQYTKNPVLNQILNETTGDLKARKRFNSPAVGLAEDMGKIGVSDNSVITGGVKELLAEATATGATPSVMDVKQALPDPIKKALNRDYRKFMKAVDAKKNGGVSNPMIAGIDSSK